MITQALPKPPETLDTISKRDITEVHAITRNNNILITLKGVQCVMSKKVFNSLCNPDNTSTGALVVKDSMDGLAIWTTLKF